MKTAGLIGGIAPETTIQYYRQIIDLYRARSLDGGYPPLIIDSIDLQKLLYLLGAGKLEAVTAYLLAEIGRLHRAGADFAALASTTAHVVFAALQAQSPIPLVSIVAAARDAAQTMRLTRAGLIGTHYTMQSPMYPDVFGAAGLAVFVPTLAEQAFIDGKFMTELVYGVLLPGTRARLLEIVAAMLGRHEITGLLLAGAELPMLLTAPEYFGITVLDTTKLHVARIVDAMLQA